MRMVPTRRLALFALLATGVAIVAGYVAALRTPLFAIDGVLVLGVLADALFAFGSWKPRIDVQRQAADIFSAGRPNAVTLQLRNRSGRASAGASPTTRSNRAPRSAIRARSLSMPAERRVSATRSSPRAGVRARSVR